LNKREVEFAKIAIDTYIELGKIYLKDIEFDYECSWSSPLNTQTKFTDEVYT